MITYLNVFIDAIGECAADLGLSFKESDLNRRNGEVRMGMSEESKGG